VNSLPPDPAFSAALLAWYAQNARELPWRGVVDPYAVWVSEIMLQQTRVETVIPYYQRWMERFPDFATLAQASLGEVLALWEGLGYYSRARNMQRSAQVIMEKWDGKLPQQIDALRSLPGAGAYTAGAIASIAFGQDEAALDGNIRRVLARYFNTEQPADSPAGERRLWELAQANLPPGRAGDYNQAMMDLGASICTGRAPRCSACPIAPGCQARQLGLQDQRPVKRARSTIPHHTVTAAVIQRSDELVLIAQRPVGGLLGGLWEFPGGKLQPGEDLASCLQREICEELGVEIQVGSDLGIYRHAYTHFRVTLHAFACLLCDGAQPEPIQVQDLRWVKISDLTDYPMGKIDRQIARRLQAEELH
jgi:A/G-specific adenine glycosylase